MPATAMDPPVSLVFRLPYTRQGIEAALLGAMLCDL